MKCYAFVSVVMAIWLVGVAGSPVPQESDASLPTWRTRGVKPVQEDKAAYIKKLEAELVTAVEAGAVAEAVKMEQQLEDEILVSAVRTLYNDRDDKNKLEEDKKIIAELVNRDKRAVELLSGVLGGSSGGGSSGGGEGSEDGGGSNVLSLITPLLGSSSGGGGDDGEGGGGSDILGLLGPLLGGLSGPANFPDPATNTKLLTSMLYRVEEIMKTGEEEVLISLVPSLDSWEDSGGGDDGADGGGSNVLSLLSGLLGGSSGGGGDGEAGGGSNVLSLLSGLLGSSSGGGGDGEDGGGSNVLSLVSGLFGSSSKIHRFSVSSFSCQQLIFRFFVIFWFIIPIVIIVFLVFIFRCDFWTVPPTCSCSISITLLWYHHVTCRARAAI
uniref:Uncharacterized protein n=1 Tax=Timema cristinae TaxID=61476 RepID=A0A7R9C8Z7_TIMCR|nr:unnamed protein product [Timema cristinae]